MSEEKIDKAIKWSEIEEENFSTTFQWTNPLILLMTSAAINLTLNAEKIKSQSLETGVILLYLIFCALFFSWLIQGLLNTGRKQKFEIRKLLKLYKVDI